MQIETHNLHHEFPEFRALISKLKGRDIRFTKELNEYEALDLEIRNIEIDGLKISDSEIEKMKLQRVHLKDSLYAYLKKMA
jgi:uncharacterized protein